MSTAEQLFAMPVVEDRLPPVEQCLLARIDEDGDIGPRDAGELVYRQRGYRSTLAVRPEWIVSAGVRALRKLEQRGLVRRQPGRHGHWERIEVAS